MSQHESSKWLDKNLLELRKYDNQWVAANSVEIVSYGASFDYVSEQLSQMDIDLSEVTFTFVTFDVLI